MIFCRALDGVETISSAKLEDEISASELTNDGDNSTFVAVIITLSILVIILLCAGFVGWWFWIRPTEWKHIEENTSVDSVKVERSSPPVGDTIEEMAEKERPSVALNGYTWTGESIKFN